MVMHSIMKKYILVPLLALLFIVQQGVQASATSCDYALCCEAQQTRGYKSLRSFAYMPETANFCIELYKSLGIKGSFSWDYTIDNCSDFQEYAYQQVLALMDAQAIYFLGHCKEQLTSKFASFKTSTGHPDMQLVGKELIALLKTFNFKEYQKELLNLLETMKTDYPSHWSELFEQNVKTLKTTVCEKNRTNQVLMSIQDSFASYIATSFYMTSAAQSLIKMIIDLPILKPFLIDQDNGIVAHVLTALSNNIHISEEEIVRLKKLGFASLDEEVVFSVDSSGGQLTVNMKQNLFRFIHEISRYNAQSGSLSLAQWLQKHDFERAVLSQEAVQIVLKTGEKISIPFYLALRASNFSDRELYDYLAPAEQNRQLRSLVTEKIPLEFTINNDLNFNFPGGWELSFADLTLAIAITKGYLSLRNPSAVAQLILEQLAKDNLIGQMSFVEFLFEQIRPLIAVDPLIKKLHDLFEKLKSKELCEYGQKELIAQFLSSLQV